MIRLFGTTIRETVNAFRGTHLGTHKVGPSPEPSDKIKAIGRIIVSVALLGLCGFLFAGDDGKQKMASGFVGAFDWLLVQVTDDTRGQPTLEARRTRRLSRVVRAEGTRGLTPCEPRPRRLPC